MTQM